MKHVIAFSKPFYRDLARRLEGAGHEFIVLEDKKNLNLETLRKINPRYVFLPHWSFIIPPEVYENFECVIFHMTELPFGRGGSPLQNLIVRGFKKTKMTAIRCSAGLDAGPIYLQRELGLEGSAREIFSRAADLIGGMIEEIIEQQPAPRQQEGEPTLFCRRSPQESDLAPIASPEQAYDHIRMLDADGYPLAFLNSEYLSFEFSNAVWEGENLVAKVKIGKKGRENGE